ncbi:MAG: hypothetical protein JSW58_02345 [Candidatus Latescibacterota bacterium]|nr:MAG: hypothetical protein JSW58_02345 [Candidatus Latescibacterota bacterium]
MRGREAIVLLAALLSVLGCGSVRPRGDADRRGPDRGEIPIVSDGSGDEDDAGRHLGAGTEGEDVSPLVGPFSTRDDTLVHLDDLLADGESVPESDTDVVALIGGDYQNTATMVSRRANRDRSNTKPGDPGISWRVTGVGGSGSDLKARAEGGGVFTLGLRMSETSPTVGYVTLGRWGIIRSVHVGVMNVRMGEKLILGRRLGRYPVTATGSVRDGMVVSSSLSRWFGRPGVFVEMGKGGARGRLLLAGASDDTALIRPRTLWLSLYHNAKRVGVGVAVGEQLEGLDGARYGSQRSRPAVVSIQTAFRARPIESSIEIARYMGSRLFVALRVVDRNRKRALRWRILCFRAPYFSSSVDPLLDLRPPDRTNQGARLDVSLARSPVRTSFLLMTGQLRSPLERMPYRRLMVTVSRRSRHSVFWECSLYRVDEIRYRYPSDGLTKEADNSRNRETKFRATLGVDNEGRFSHRLRVDYLPGHRRPAGGVLLSLASRLVAGDLEMQWQLAAHSLVPGQRGYIARSGVGPFDCFSAVSGRGSDVSVRLRWRVWKGVTVTAYHRTTWSKTGRTYLGLDYRR